MNGYGTVYGGAKPADDDGEAIDTLEQQRPNYTKPTREEIETIALDGTYLLDGEEEAARLRDQFRREIVPSPTDYEAKLKATIAEAQAELARREAAKRQVVERPSRDEFFFQMAELASTMATCPRAHCGAVIVRHKRSLSLGYNGVDEGQEHCPSEGEALAEHLALDHCLASTHAEVNAIKNAIGNVYGATIYVYGHYAPCINCKGELARVGITDIRHRPGQHYGVTR